MVYKNQIEAATEIVHELFGGNKVVVTLIALPQVGKTGTFLEVAYRACTHPDDTSIIDPRNVFIITGMSDRDWQKQTETDMLEPFKRRVYHRGKLNTKDREDGFYTNLANARDALIILDECHIAVEKTHLISSNLKRLGLLDIAVLRARNIKILEVSATPGATLRDTQSWGAENHSIVTLNESPTYIGFKDFIREGRLHDSFDLAKEEEVTKLAAFVKATFPEPRWHILRLSAKSKAHATFEERFKAVCAAERWNIQNHSAIDRVGDIDYHMSKRPTQHTFLIIKEFWRAGKRLNDAFVGVVHELTAAVKDTNVTAQGLAGRLCGNDKRKGPGAPHIFCNVQLIHEYIDWIKHKGDFNAVKAYHSKNLTVKDGRVTSSRETFAHHSNMTGVAEVKDPYKYALTETFASRREAHAWASANIEWTHADLLGLGQAEAWNVGTSGGDGVFPGNTHYRGENPQPIRTEEEERRASDLGRFGGGVRCAPIRVGNTLKFLVIYKNGWKKPAVA